MKINPLSILGIRKLSSIPEYFQVHSFCIDDNTSDNYQICIRDITEWIEEFLHGRYAINYINISGRSKIRIGFEDPLEYTYFQLGCPHL